MKCVYQNFILEALSDDELTIIAVLIGLGLGLALGAGVVELVNLVTNLF